jgi:hypothetical protein
MGGEGNQINRNHNNPHTQIYGSAFHYHINAPIDPALMGSFAPMAGSGMNASMASRNANGTTTFNNAAEATNYGYGDMSTAANMSNHHTHAPAANALPAARTTKHKRTATMDEASLEMATGAKRHKDGEGGGEEGGAAPPAAE